MNQPPTGWAWIMGSIGWYIFRTTFSAFLLILFSLTTVIWLTHALRDIDLMTDQGQTILVFIGITGLIIPQLILIIAPIALMIAIAPSLNKLAHHFHTICLYARSRPVPMAVGSCVLPRRGCRLSHRCRDRRLYLAEVPSGATALGGRGAG